jgi:hypothetical protein
MTQQTARQPEPRVFVRIARYMSEADLAQFYHQNKQKINDARHKQQAREFKVNLATIEG